MVREDVVEQMCDHMKEIIIEKKETLINLVQSMKLLPASEFSVDLIKMRVNYDYIPKWIHEINNSIVQEHIEEIKEEISRFDNMLSTIDIT